MQAVRLPNGNIKAPVGTFDGQRYWDEYRELAPGDALYARWDAYLGRAAKPALLAYSEDQPRDEHGRWVGEGGGAATAEVPGPRPAVNQSWSEAELQQVGVDSSVLLDEGGLVFGHTPDGPPDIMNSHEEKYADAQAAGVAYQSYGELNDVLRGDMPSEMIGPKMNDQIDALTQDAAGPLTENVTAFRQYDAPPDSEIRGWLTEPGAIIQDPGFLSTSTSPNIGGVALRDNAHEDRVWVALDVPQGTDVVWLDGDHRENTPFGVREEGGAPFEMLLMPGHPIEITGPPTYNANNEMVVPARALGPGWEGYYQYGDENAPHSPEI